MERSCIVGLGNPGPEYSDTRHNLGFRVIDALSDALRCRPFQRVRHYLYAEGSLEDRPLLLVRPTTFMNRSGLAVAGVIARWGLPLTCLLVVVDDVSLPLGRLRLRPQGSDGGHNGLASIIEALGSSDFPRLRLGIGPPGEGTDMIDHVLSPFRPDEIAPVAQMIGRAAETVRSFVLYGVELTMSKFNG